MASLSTAVVRSAAFRRFASSAAAATPHCSRPTSVGFVSSRWMSTYYTHAHEYIKVDGNVGTVGITDFAQAALGDIVFVDLPETDDEFEKGESFGSVESVKAASDVYVPVSGTVVGVNDALTDEPGLVNASAEDDAWFIKLELSDDAELEGLMGEEDYKAHCEKESS